MEIRTIDGISYGPMQAITPDGSPFSWQNPEACIVAVSVAGGAVTQVEIANEAQLVWMTWSLEQGMFMLKPRSWIRVTYTLIAPTMYYTPY